MLLFDFVGLIEMLLDRVDLLKSSFSAGEEI